MGLGRKKCLKNVQVFDCMAKITINKFISNCSLKFCTLWLVRLLDPFIYLFIFLGGGIAL